MAEAVAIEVRVASREDESSVLELFSLHEQHRTGSRGAESYLAFFDTQDIFTGLQTNGPPWVLLALADDVVLGIATLEINEGTDVRYGSLRCLFALSHDDQSIIEASLLTYAGSLATTHGCSGLDIEVLPGDQHLKSLLEEAGYKARLLTMHRSFGSVRQEDQ